MSVELNFEQSQAAKCLDRPVLVTAGAGSGKTRMLTQRFANAVVPGAIRGWEAANIDEVVAITFTEKAAGEIAERARLALLGAGLTDLARDMGKAWVSTIHGMCSRILRSHPFEAGIDPLFTVGDAVLIGEFRAEAFESAAREVLAHDAATQELVERYSFQALFSAVVKTTRELAVLGASPESLMLEPTESAAELVAAAEELFRLGRTSCELGYSGTSANPSDHATHCEELLGRCSPLVSVEYEESEALAELLLALDAYKPLKRLKGLEEIAEELRASAESLRGRVAAALTACCARTFKALACAYQRAYGERKTAAGILDFDDLQLKAVALLQDDPSLSKQYREQFRVVMIDEFQDTDALQLRLMEAISDNDLCTVGDEKQSIYRFRGADVDVYRRHQARMRDQDALEVPLDVNYRSHPDLLGFVNGVFGSDEYFGESLLRLKPPELGRVANRFDDILGDRPRAEVLFVDTTQLGPARTRMGEARAIARRLAELREAGARAGDMAVLLRSYSFAHVYAEALSREGLTAVIVGGSRFFGLPEIAIARALNRVIANPEDDTALGFLLASDFVPVTSDALALLRMGSGERDRRSLWSVLREGSAALSETDSRSIRRLVSVIETADLGAGRLPLAHVLLAAVEQSGWDLRLLSEGNVGRDAFANVVKFMRQASEFEASRGRGPDAFARHLDAKEALGDTEAPASLSDDESDAVRIMSIHASKGLEFPIVVVPELAASRRGDSSSVRVARQGDSLALAMKTPATDTGDPQSNSTWFSMFSEADSEASAQEDERVLYVAFTRAQEFLLASGSMGLHTQKPTTASHDLAKLSRVLGVTTPTEGPVDLASSVCGSDAMCRLRVIEPSETEADLAERRSDLEGEVLPPAAGSWKPVFEGRQLPDRLSYTQFSEFEHCPKRFWVRRVLGARNDTGVSVDDASPLEFGTALHAALRLVAADGSPPAEERLAAIGRYFGLSVDDAARLGEAVRRYCDSTTASEAASGGVIRRESPFSIEVGGGRFFVAGAIDLYTRTGDSALVVDYKSGETGDSSVLVDRYRLQAECYALAVLKDGCTSAKVEFVRPEAKDADGSIQTTTFEFTARDAARIEQDLQRRYDAIERSEFEPMPSQECASCDVVPGLCPHAGGERRAG